MCPSHESHPSASPADCGWAARPAWRLWWLLVTNPCCARAQQLRNATISRWTPAMLPTVTEALWRKSPQWVALNRRHAELAATDIAVNAAIRDHCTVGYDDLLGR